MPPFDDPRPGIAQTMTFVNRMTAGVYHDNCHLRLARVNVGQVIH